MELICYLPPSQGRPNPAPLLAAHLGGIPIEVFHSLPEFLRRLLRPAQGERCVLAAPLNAEELTALVSQEELLRDPPLILISPNGHGDLLNLAHRLRPRFLADHQAPPEEILAVVERIFAKLAREKAIRFP